MICAAAGERCARSPAAGSYRELVGRVSRLVNDPVRVLPVVRAWGNYGSDQCLVPPPANRKPALREISAPPGPIVSLAASWTAASGHWAQRIGGSKC